MCATFPIISFRIKARFSMAPIFRKMGTTFEEKSSSISQQRLYGAVKLHREMPPRLLKPLTVAAHLVRAVGAVSGTVAPVGSVSAQAGLALELPWNALLDR